MTRAKKHTATVAELAAFNFEPWDASSDCEMSPTNKHFAEYLNIHLTTYHLALMNMYKTKAELTEIYGKIDNETGLAIMNGFINARAFFEHFITVLDAAQARILCAGSSYLQGAAAADRSLRKIARDHGNKATKGKPK